ncbi:hypothetical protein [Kytococcus sedentarius]
MINTMIVNAVAHAARLRVAPQAATSRSARVRSHLIADPAMG